MEKLKRAVAEENAFWERQGFAGYSTTDENGQAHPAHRAWVKVVESEGRAFDSPMARKMFVLGWLYGQRAK